jgi:hypothetical protein
MIQQKRRKVASQTKARKKKKEDGKQGKRNAHETIASDEDDKQEIISDIELVDSPSSPPQHVVKVTTYIEVLIPSPTQPKTRNKAIPTVLTRGPFFFETNISFDEFKLLVAQNLPALPSSLNWSKMSWKYDVASCTPKPISDLLGYEAMIIALCEWKKNHIIKVLTPPPVKSEMVCQFMLDMYLGFSHIPVYFISLG